MKLINVEEHYMSPTIAEKIKTILSKQEGNASPAIGDLAPGGYGSWGNPDRLYE